MQPGTAEYIEAINHLPTETLLVREDVTWQEYVQLLEELVERPSVRVMYDEGHMEILVVGPQHGSHNALFENIVGALRDELDIDAEAFGNTTWLREQYQKGSEADCSYYIANAKQVIGRQEFVDIDVDPPPDLVIEVEVSHRSLKKFPIYAAFGVHEIWRYDVKRKKALIYQLREGSYIEVPRSPSFPILTGEALTTVIEQSKKLGQRTAIRAFREWIKKASAR